MEQALRNPDPPQTPAPPPLPGVTRRARTFVLNALERVIEQGGGAPSAATVSRHLQEAADALQRAQQEPDDTEALQAAMRAMSEALAAAREDTRLVGEACRALELVAEAMAMLYPVLHDHGIRRPPPIPWRRPRPKAASERRRHRRITFETEVSLHGDHNFFTGFSEDISEGGLFVATYDQKPLGTRIELTFGLPCGHVVQCEGEVRWLRPPSEDPDAPPPGMGIRFLDLSETDREIVQRYIAQRTPLFYEED